MRPLHLYAIWLNLRGDWYRIAGEPLAFVHKGDALAHLDWLGFVLSDDPSVPRSAYVGEYRANEASGEIRNTARLAS